MTQLEESRGVGASPNPAAAATLAVTVALETTHISAQATQAKGGDQFCASRALPPVTARCETVQHGDVLWLLTPVSLTQHRLQ